MDEGASTCVMSSLCWKAIGSLALNSSPNALEAFYERESKPLGVLTSLLITLKGNMVNVEVEVVDYKLNYNLLLGHSWTHAMLFVPSTLFHVLKFPHEGKLLLLINCPSSPILLIKTFCIWIRFLLSTRA